MRTRVLGGEIVLNSSITRFPKSRNNAQLLLISRLLVVFVTPPDKIMLLYNSERKSKSQL